MRPKSVADEQRQLALALELSKREIAAGGRRSSRVGTRILYLCFVFTCGLQAEAAILRTNSKLFRRLSDFTRVWSKSYRTSRFVFITVLSTPARQRARFIWR